MKKLISLLIICLLLASCHGGDEFAGGRPITKEELASLSAELSGGTKEPTETTPNDGTVLYLVYWSEGGSVYHCASDCRHLKDAKSVHVGSIREAQENGKEKACSACASG